MSVINRGQVALEFLYTYGWAFMVVIVAIGALTFLVDFDSYVADTCYIAEAFSCDDYALTGQTMKLNIKNVAGKSIVFEELGCDYEGTPENKYDPTSSTTIPPGDKLTISCEFPSETIPEDKKSKVTFTVAYHELQKSFFTYSDGYIVATRS